MEANDTPRLTRLTAILTQLQTKRLTTAAELADRFGVSKRTIYRDIRALEGAGVPIYTEEGRGYALVEGYRVPPVMFTEEQANALILAEQLVQRNPDASLVRAYTEAVDKVKAVLHHGLQDKVNLLADRTRYDQNVHAARTSNLLSELQFALTNFRVVRIAYTNEAGTDSSRLIEPFALVSTRENWLLVAWCRLRTDFRYFRLDRMRQLALLTETFTPHDMTLQQFFERHPG